MSKYQLKLLRRLMITWMMMGAPMMGVMALSGSRPLSPGSVLMRLHSRAMAAPQSMVVGSSVR